MTPQELKSSIIQMALKGQLTVQSESESVEELLSSISLAKQKLFEKGLLKKTKLASTVAEAPFDIPSNWKWVYLHDIAYINGGYAFKSSQYSDTGVRIIRISDFNENGFSDTKIVRQPFSKELEPFVIENKNILLCMTGGTVGKTLFVQQMKEKMVTNQRVATIKILNPNEEFINFVIMSPFIQKIIQKSKNSTNDNISMDTINLFPIPLPPLEEQNRIVDFLNSISYLIEKYERSWSKLEMFNKDFPRNMKCSLLHAAMCGKLVPQLETDGSVNETIKKIEDSKNKLLKDNKISRQKKIPQISLNDILYEIPDKWKWARLGDVVYNHGQKTPDKVFSYIDIGSIDNENQKLNDFENVLLPNKAPSRARKIVLYGDVIYSTVRPYLHNVCIINKKFSNEPIASTGFAVLCPFEGLYNKFLFYYLLSPQFDSYANDRENSRGVAYPAINDDKLYKALVPIPPLKEQIRIVNKLEEVLPLCNKLKKE